MRETSHGTVTLKSNDPREHPLIDPNYLATEQDRVDMRNGLKVARDILSQQAFAPYRGDEILPGKNTTFRAYDEMSRDFIFRV